MAVIVPAFSSTVPQCSLRASSFSSCSQCGARVSRCRLSRPRSRQPLSGIRLKASAADRPPTDASEGSDTGDRVPAEASTTSRVKSVQRRVATGVAMGAVVIGCVLCGRLPFFVLMASVQLLGQLEYYRMVIAKGHLPAFKMGLVCTATLLLTIFIAPNLADAVFPVGGTFTCIYLLFRRRKIATIADISTTFMGLFYAGFLPSFWLRLHGVSNIVAGATVATAAGPTFDLASTTMLSGMISRVWPLAVPEAGPLLVFWSWLSCASADIGAFFVGRTLGRTRLSNISPKKTIEGALAGFICSAGVSMLGAFLLHWPMWQITGALYGITVGVVGLCGDLIASSFKRDVGWKDSGQLFPGHGGILDRADSYVLIAPLVYYFVTLVLPML